MKTQEEFLEKVWEIAKSYVEFSTWGTWIQDVFKEELLKAFNEYE